jgi:hypothetical protein
VQAVQLLLELKANLLVTTAAGVTPLMLAVAGNKTACVDAILCALRREVSIHKYMSMLMAAQAAADGNECILLSFVVFWKVRHESAAAREKRLELELERASGDVNESAYCLMEARLGHATARGSRFRGSAARGSHKRKHADADADADEDADVEA